MATRNERWGIKVGDSVRLRAYGDEEIVRVVVGITDSGRLVIANPAELEVARREGRKPAPPHSFVAASDADVLGRPFCAVCGNREPNPLHAADDPRDEDDDVEAIVDEQAEDDGLWFAARTAPEGYLQQELRRLHAAIERRRGVAVPQAGTFTALEAARLAVGFGDGEDYCGSCGAHWRDIQNGCRLHPLWNVLASTEAERAVQAGGGDAWDEAARRFPIGSAYINAVETRQQDFIAGADWATARIEREQAGGGDDK